MRRAGLNAAGDVLRKASGTRSGGRNVAIPADIRAALKEDPIVWRNFSKFPASYKRIRVGWIDGSRNRPDFFERRLNYFIKMTRQNKRFGMVQ
jgi:hypothetical protein